MEKNNKSKHTDKTKTYEIQSKNGKKNEKKEPKGENGVKTKKKHSKLKKAILIFFILMVLLGLTGVGIVAGIFFSDKWEITKDDLLITQQNSTVYDSDGKKIGETAGDENRKIVALDQMGKYTVNAFICIEDERFYEHAGVDILRSAKAMVEYFLHAGSSSFGGSTITQQLVKNLMKDKADEGMAGIERKIREMSRAYQIEKMLSKEQVLDNYLNVIFMGGNVYGVESASEYYFSKSAKDLTLAESAFIAGINNAPNMYDPYDESVDHTDLIKRRTKTVLAKMKELNKISGITEEEYNQAVADAEKGFTFKKGITASTSNISYHTAAAINEIANDFAEAKDIDYATARTMILSGGYSIYTTQVTEIQEKIEKEFAKKSTYVTTTTEKDSKGNKVIYKTEGAMVIIDHTTGKVVGEVGGFGEDANVLGNNRGTQISRQTGSAIKPLSNVAPGLEEGIITAATVYDDTLTNFGSSSKPYQPRNSTGYQGLCTVRKAIEVSSNIVNIKIISNVSTGTAVRYLNQFGLTNFNSDDEVLSLAIGGSKNGTNPLGMAAAYGAIANKGEYIEPTFYNKLVDANGKTVLEPKQEKHRVLTEANAYVLSSILTAPVTGSNGTAYKCAISGMDVAAKTGTAEDAKDKWLCGYTPYYSAAVWYGYDQIEKGVSKTNSAINIWANVMKSVHKELSGKRFEKPGNIVSAKICKDTGKLATDKCTNTYSEIFVKGTVPTACDGHTAVKICKVSGKIATQYCTETEDKYYATRPEKEINPKWSTNGSSKYTVPTEKCNVHTAETSKIVVQDVVGKTLAEAKTALTGLTIQVIYSHDSSKADGIVLKQSIAKDTKVDKGVTIVITVNKITTTPDPGGNTEKPGGNTEKPGGNTENPGNNTTGNNTTGNTEKPKNNTTKN